MKKISYLLALSLNLNLYAFELPVESFLPPLSDFFSLIDFFNNPYFGVVNVYTEKSEFYKDYSFGLKSFSMELINIRKEAKHELTAINWSANFLSLFENPSKEKKHECPCKIRARMEAEKRRKAAEHENAPENYFAPGNFDEENETRHAGIDKFQNKQKESKKLNEPKKNKKKGCGCKGNRVDLGHPNKDYLNGGFKPWSRAAIHRRHRISQNIDYAITHGRK